MGTSKNRNKALEVCFVIFLNVVIYFYYVQYCDFFPIKCVVNRTYCLFDLLCGSF